MITQKSGRWVAVDAADATEGDMAQYNGIDRVLDPRQVLRVTAAGVYLDILGTESGPFPREQYDYSRYIREA